MEKAIVQMEGINIGGFLSIEVFTYLLTPQMEKLKEPAMELIQDIYSHLEILACQIIDRIFQRFPQLKPEIIDIVTQVLVAEREHTRVLVENIIEAEQNCIFTNDIDFKENRTGAGPGGDPQQ